METISSVPAAAKKKMVFSYDYMGRRVTKSVQDWDVTSSTWLAAKTRWFYYDAWNLVGEVSEHSSTGVIARYLWGLDLSGSLQGAGGVGGLLSIDTGGTHSFVATDANGNVMNLVDVQTLESVGEYEYGPFGELIRMTGPRAKDNPFRFSTKYQDEESGLLYYGYRYYDAEMGRWLSRDPIEENGGNNLYKICTPTNSIDVLGLYEYHWQKITKLIGWNEILNIPIILETEAFTPYEKALVRRSINQVNSRTIILMAQILNEIKEIEKRECLHDLLGPLHHVLGIMDGMHTEITDPEWDLGVYKANRGGDPLARYWDSPVPWYSDWLELDIMWFKVGEHEQNLTMFHEITHGQDTEDYTDNPFNDANALEKLMYVDFPDWSPYWNRKRQLEQKCPASNGGGNGGPGGNGKPCSGF